MKTFSFSLLLWAWAVSLYGQDGQLVTHPLPVMVDNRLGAVLSEDSEEVTAFLSPGSTSLQVFSPTSGLRTLLNSAQPSWVCASPHGTYALASTGSSPRQFFRIHIPSGASVALPGYPLPVGASQVQQLWEWVEEDGSAVTRLSWVLEGGTVRRTLRLRADLTAFEEIVTPAMPWDTKLQWRIKDGDFVIAQQKTLFNWLHVTRMGVEQYLKPEVHEGGGIGSYQLSKNGDWLIGVDSGFTTGVLRRWDLRGSFIPEPQAVENRKPTSNWGFIRVSNDGTLVGSFQTHFYSYVEPFVWLPNGAYMDEWDLGLRYLAPAFKARGVLDISADRKVLVGNAADSAQSPALWVMRRSTPLNKEPRTRLEAMKPNSTNLWSGAHLSFSVAEPGLSLTQTVVFRNEGEAVLEDLRIELVGGGASHFNLTRMDARTLLRPLEKTTVSIAFTAPDERGYRADLLVHSPTLAEPYVLRLGGGLPPPTCTVERPLGNAYTGTTFPPTELGSSVNAEIFIRNTSTTQPLYDPRVEVYGHDDRPSTQFSIEKPPPEVLAPGAVGSFILRFHPTVNKTALANLRIQLGAVATIQSRSNNTYSIRGLVGPQPHIHVRGPDGILRVGHTTYSMNSVETHRLMSFDFEVTNKSLMPLSLISTQTADIRPVVLPKQVLAHNESMTVTVQGLWSHPQQNSVFPQVWLYDVNSPPGSGAAPLGSLRLAIQSITSFVPHPVMKVHDSSDLPRASGEITLDFGERTVGLTASLDLEVFNSSNAANGYSDWLNLNAATSAPFGLGFNPTSILQNRSSRLPFTFSPTVPGSFSGEVRLTTNDPDRPFYIIHVKGQGLAPAAPAFVKTPKSQIVSLGQNVEIPVEVNGARDLTVTLMNEQSGQISQKVWPLHMNHFSLNKVTPAQAGELRIEATNSHGTAISEPFYLAVTSPTETKPRSMLGGQKLKLTAVASGVQISRRWQKDGVWLTDTARRTGSTAEVLDLSDLTVEDSGDYRCEISIPGETGPVTQFTPVQTVLVTEKPVIQVAAPLPEAVAGTLADIPLIITRSPKIVTVTGLPQGVSFDADQKKLVGRIEAARGYQQGSLPFDITITAKNAAGTTVQKTSWIVRPPHPLPDIQLPEMLPDATAGLPYQTSFSVLNSPTSITASGLPAGLSFSGSSISGETSKVTSSPVKVTITATNYAGTTTKTALLRVLPHPYQGSYEAILSRHRDMDSDLALGGRLTLTVATSGAYTCKFQCAMITGSITGVATRSSTGMTIDYYRRIDTTVLTIPWIIDLHLELSDEGVTGHLEVLSFSSAKLRHRGGRMTVTGVQIAHPLAVTPASLVGRHTAQITHHQPPGRQWRQEGGIPYQPQLNTRNTAAEYSALGSTSATSQPGSRIGSYTWTGHDGLLHLFGGYGVWSRSITRTAAKNALRADHWVFDPETLLWSWQSGQRTGDPRPRAPVVGLSPNNFPGARTSGVSWVDGKGDFWLFGGVYTDFANVTHYNDLWRFVPHLKAWEQVQPNGPASHGQKSLPSATNQPPARSDACGWTDPDGNLWLFGGTTSSLGALSTPNCWNDLWKFDITIRQWTWISGSDSQNAPNQLTAPAHPSSREVPAIWPDPLTGDVLLYGGHGSIQEAAPVTGDYPLSDLWLWTHATQTWSRIHGNSSYAMINAGTRPPPTYLARAWRSPEGLCYLHPEQGESSEYRFYDGTWQYDPATATWTKQVPSSSDASPGSAILNTPSSHAGATWQGIDGTAWFHGGIDHSIQFYDYLYSHGTARVPTTPGWLALGVSPQRVVTWAGMLGDGTRITGSSSLAVRPIGDGTHPWVMRSAPAGNYESVQGQMHFTPPSDPAALTSLLGDLTAIKNLRPTAKRGRSYRSGWPVHALSLNGSSYQPPASGNLVLGLAAPGTSVNASLSTTLPGTASPLTVPLLVSEKAAIASTLPDPITKLKLTLTPATGVFTGTATISSTAAPFTPSSPLLRTAELHGVMQPTEATGLLLVPDLPTTFVPAKLTPIRASALRLYPLTR